VEAAAHVEVLGDASPLTLTDGNTDAVDAAGDDVVLGDAPPPTLTDGDTEAMDGRPVDATGDVEAGWYPEGLRDADPTGGFGDSGKVSAEADGDKDDPTAGPIGDAAADPCGEASVGGDKEDNIDVDADGSMGDGDAAPEGEGDDRTDTLRIWRSEQLPAE
jgi:hypothetical protein